MSEITPATIRELQKNFNTRFQAAFDKRAVYWDKKAMRIDSASDTEVYGWMAELADFEEWIGPRTFQALKAREHVVKNRDYQFAFRVPKRAIQFDRLNIYGQKAEQAGKAAKRIYDKLITDKQQAGATSLCWDGQFFYDTDHPVNPDDSSLGTYANRKTGFALNAANFATAYADMQGFKGENGLSLEIVPTVLEVPPALRKVAREILNAEIIINAAGTASGSNVLQADCDLIVNPRLANEPTVWYLHSTDQFAPFILQVAQDPTPLVARVNPADENVFNRNEFEFGSDAYCAADYALPFLSMRCEA